jgi:TRAP-type uncharacterized transport system fused permease subunit
MAGAAAIIAVITPWHKGCGGTGGYIISLTKRITSMDNLIPQYEPNNEVFKNVMFCALCLTAGIFYFLFKTLGHSSFQWYDWLVLAAAGAGAAFFYKQTQAGERNADRE